MKKIDKKVDATWTDDCSDKKNFDGQILALSTRYWPSHYQSNKKPSAKSSILLYWKESEDKDDFGYKSLISKEFEGESENDVKCQVEQWANEQFAKIYSAIHSIFSTDGPSSL